MGDLSGRVAVVTDGARGAGAAAVQAGDAAAEADLQGPVTTSAPLASPAPGS